MREYKKPTIQIVNLKSSEEIALTFEDAQGQFIGNYLYGADAKKRYAVTQFNIASSTPVNSTNVDA